MTAADALDEQYHQWLTRLAATTGRSLTPAATVVLFREDKTGPKILLLRRNPELRFMGGTWVFPGGKTDPADYDYAASALNPEAQTPPPEPPEGAEPLRRLAGGAAAGSPSSALWGRAYTAARAAAVRETQEETGLTPDARRLTAHSHWLPPARIPQQFATWFFLSPAPGGSVRVGNTEHQDWMWISPSEAVRRRDRGTLEIAPPTYVTLLHLAKRTSTAEALSAARREPPAFYTTVMLDLPDGGQAALWEGDAGYETGAHAEPGGPNDPPRQEQNALQAAAENALRTPGGRRRLWMPKNQPWRYEHNTQTNYSPPSAGSV